jgi:hypothetical protein
VAGAKDCRICAAVFAAEHLWVLFQVSMPPPEGTRSSIPRVMLAQYRLEQRGMTLDRSADLGTGFYAPSLRYWGYRFSRGLNGRLYALDVTLPPFDVALDDGGGGFRPAMVQVFGGWNWVYGQLVLDAGLTAYSDPEGLSIIETPRAGAAQVIGEVRAAPWARLFRSFMPLLLPAGPHRIWEVHDTSAICYDVSDPRRPRRIAHVTSYPIQDAAAGPDFLLLDHGTGFSIVMNPR